MFLKRLEIVGFKSFAERIAVDFVPGVTAVVGPNGSGKSNITDAIRWVLGEQSAKSLRGSKMEDIIFAGSASRKALNFAEVTLTLDNTKKALQTDYEEVSVTRRVFRSGDSEYLLNRQSCRLKDITELFMDSGLGREAFSIISQGKVDEILNSKAEDRRSIFEETAGVLKYKQRKKKAQFKLIETDDNLSRVLDILHELEGRIEPLEIQASIAKDYLNFAQELKEREVNLTVFDIERNEELRSQWAKQVHQAEQTLQVITNEREDVLEQLKNKRTELENLEVNLDALQDEAVTLTSDLERQEGRKLVLLEKENNAQQQVGKLTLAIKTAEQELAVLREKEKVCKQINLDKQLQVNNQKKERKRLELLLHTTSDELEQQIEQLKSDYIELLNEEAALKNEQRLLLQQTEKQQYHLKRVHEENGLVETQLKEAEKAEEQSNIKKQQAEQNLEQALQNFRNKKLRVDETVASYEKKRQLLFDGYQQLHTLRAKRDSLEELESEYNGYFHGVKELLKQRNLGKVEGVEGAIAELISIPKTYVQAIDTAIGGQAQHIVMRDNRSAQQAIAYLRTHLLGRATFLPLDTMKPRSVSAASLKLAAQHESFVATANTLVQADQRFHTIRDHLLGHIIVARDLKGANAIAKLLNYSYRVVTLDGDVINPGGSLTGGAAKKQSSVFTRKSDLENYKLSVRNLELELEKAEKIVNEIKLDKEKLEEQLESLRESGEQLRITQQQMAAEWSSAYSQAERLRDRYTSFTAQQQERGMDQQASEKRLQELEHQLASFKHQTNTIQEQIHQMTDLKTQTVKQKDTIQNQLGELFTSIAVTNEQLQQSGRDLQSLNESIEKAANQITSWKEELSWYTEEHESQSASDIDAEITRLAQAKMKHTVEIKNLRELRQQVNQSIRALEIQETHISEQFRNNLIQVEKSQFNLTKSEEALVSYHELLLEKYDLTYEEALAVYEEPEDSDKERTKIRLLKKSIDELGPVNLAAIEEFDSVQERYTFLTDQRNDLLEAQETLHQAISEMDVEMTERFSTTFFEIQHHFRIVFRQLFGGGQADLHLTNPDDMLETGIEIVAQPPGKKLQNLTLLSGGERALTAIALLFAILQTRPVPFCILDEVEAALDEANVVRYSTYLQQFSGETQFIVITHRKGTMEGADVLYGVTMQESGVSKLVSVKLEEYV